MILDICRVNSQREKIVTLVMLMYIDKLSVMYQSVFSLYLGNVYHVHTLAP